MSSPIHFRSPLRGAVRLLPLFALFVLCGCFQSTLTTESSSPQSDPKRIDAYRGMEGCVSGNCTTGYGIYVHPDRGVYFGGFLNRLRDGRGEFYFKNKDRYTGLYRAGKKHGYGEYHFHTGVVYRGTFRSGVPDGKGELVLKNGTVVSGVVKKGVLKGKMDGETGDMECTMENWVLTCRGERE